ncbi:MAG: hypothetical protein K0S23_2073 [Fluviicola sp.]|jgi:uncharacterized membrane protein YeiB|uniref:DUF418 domain-containing protein n=1 Tax=Fluviicola sp. TaxID=1917219 RepID=UPI0026148564|nr:DUF418 domain-containing protein [Fluviicola sp.]MDF3027766.1 hypothetical protein [Fluviicola sp.]
MNSRIIGFDLARAYAIFGMFIVNFNFSFGSLMSPTDSFGRFLNIFTGNSTAIFIICAGMGLSLMTSKDISTREEKRKIKSKVLKRSWFLFALGLILYSWWSGDILHFYGGYMHLAAFLLFLNKRLYLLFAFLAIIVFHILLLIIPIETGWGFNFFLYTDFWSLKGFLRNTFYNGWNSFFPWVAYFLLGMWLGKLNWNGIALKRRVFLIGLGLFLLIKFGRFLAFHDYFDPFWTNYILAEYFPPYLPFMLITIGFALMVIPVCIALGERFSNNQFILALQKTGQMTLSLYVIHLTLGMIILGLLTGKTYTGLLEDEKPTPPAYIFAYAVLFYIFSVFFSVLWRKRFNHGPFESLMRKISG